MEENESLLQVISSIIMRCEKVQLKFELGTSQYTLLKNRINAMYISKSLLMNEDKHYTTEELSEAVLPVSSIISKCKKAQAKHNVDSSVFKRFELMIHSMETLKQFLMNKICERNL